MSLEVPPCESRSPVEGSLRLSGSGPGPIPGRLPFRLNWVTAFLGVLLTSVSIVDGEPSVVGTWKRSPDDGELFVYRIDPSGAVSLTWTVYGKASFALAVNDDTLAAETLFTTKAVWSGTWEAVGDSLWMDLENPEMTVNDLDPETYIAETVSLLAAEMAGEFEELFGQAPSEGFILELEEAIEARFRITLEFWLAEPGRYEYYVAIVYELDEDTLTLYAESGVASTWERVPDENISTAVRPASWGQIKKATMERYRSR